MKTKGDVKLFYIPTKVWTHIPDLGIDVYQAIGHQVAFIVDADGVYNTGTNKIKWSIRKHTDG